MKIYTKTGDSGETTLFGGGRVPKNDLRVEACGTVDELNAYLGVIRTYDLPEPAQDWLETIQNALFKLGADLATPQDVKSGHVVRVAEDAALMLEQAIDHMDAEITPLKQFILPGGTRPVALLHVARTVCRRSERVCVALGQSEAINSAVIIYLNRLADFLFTLSRWVNHRTGESESRWAVRP